MHLINKGAILALIASTVVYGQGPMIGHCPILPADNIWNTPVDKLPVSSNSAAYINSMGSGLPLRSDFGSGMYDSSLFGMPFAKVSGTQTKYPAIFVYQQESDPGPYAIPLDASLEGGSDRHAIALDMDNCILYEIFSATPRATSWYGGGGAIFDLKSNALRPYGWTSADAAGLPIMPGLVRYDEIVAGEIRHALRVSAAYTQKSFVWPARHWASYYDDPQHPPLGTRLRLRADFDVSKYPREIQIIMKGLKKYGMMIADNGASWFFGGEPDPRWDNDMLRLLLDIKGSDFEVVDVSSLMIDPNSGQAKQEGAPAVAVTPSSATVTTQATRQFSANQAVTWSVNDIPGGNSQVGYVDANGIFSAPGTVPTPSTVQLKATNGSSVGTASITIRYPAPLIASVSPTTMPAGNFTLTVNGTGFQTGSVVRVNGTAATTTVNSSSSLAATGSIATTSSVIPVTIVNPDGQVSKAANIAVTAPVISATRLQFVPVQPCRLADTRAGQSAATAFSAPTPVTSPNAGWVRTLTIQNLCGVPANAQAYSLNVTAVPQQPLGFLTIWSAGQSQPLVSTLNAPDGRIKASAAIVPAGTSSSVNVFITNPSDVIVDVNGYFVAPDNPAGLAFYPIDPCRVVDTRDPARGPLGSPGLSANATRSFNILSATACNIPASARAFSLNYTVAPPGPLSYLTTWPTGKPQPLVSTLNAPTGAVTANAAIVPADTGSVDVFASNNTHLIIDINGYFAPPGGANALSFYNLTPCRVLDTRLPSGTPLFTGTLTGINPAGCAAPATARTYVLSATAVAPAPLGYLTLWGNGTGQPLVSTLNAGDRSVTSNMAIVPSLTGSINAFVSDPSHLILDISGYFAP